MELSIRGPGRHGIVLDAVARFQDGGDEVGAREHVLAEQLGDASSQVPAVDLRVPEHGQELFLDLADQVVGQHRVRLAAGSLARGVANNEHVERAGQRRFEGRTAWRRDEGRADPIADADGASC